MNMAALKHSAGNVRLVGIARAQTRDRGRLVAERGEKLERKFARIKRLLGEFGYGFFDFDGVHAAMVYSGASASPSGTRFIMGLSCRAMMRTGRFQHSIRVCLSNRDARQRQFRVTAHEVPVMLFDDDDTCPGKLRHSQYRQARPD